MNHDDERLDIDGPPDEMAEEDKPYWNVIDEDGCNVYEPEA